MTRVIRTDRVLWFASLVLIAVALCSCSGTGSENAVSSSDYDSQAWRLQNQWFNEQEDGDFLRYVRRMDLAEDHLKRAVAMARRFGDNDPRLARSLTALARVYLVKEQYERSIPLLETSLKIKREKFGEKNSDVADILNDLALAKVLVGETNQARSLIERAKQIREEINDSFVPPESYLVDALILTDEGNLDAAERAYDRVAGNYSKIMEPTFMPPSTENIQKLQLCLERYSDLLARKRAGKKAKSIQEKLSGVEEWLELLGHSGV